MHRCFDDFDELAAAARLWDLDFLQLDCGAFEGEIFQAVAGRVLLSEGRFGRTLKQEGAAPNAMRTFVVPATPTLHFRWRRKDVGPNDLLVFPRNAELHAASQPDFHVYTISLPESLLHEAAELSDVVRLSESLRCEKIHGSALCMDRLRHRLRNIVHAAKRVASTPGHLAVLAKLQEEIPRLLVKVMAAAEGPAEVCWTRKRDRAVKRAEEYIAQSQDEPLTIRDVCLAVKVSERTLQYGFLEHFSVPPKTYLQAVRLNGVHRDLKAADPRARTVSEIASRWGFWHMGQFAADYRKHFGRLPSETLTVESIEL
jgi:AraC family ethanolamine operon transcriptional activator